MHEFVLYQHLIQGTNQFKNTQIVFRYSKSSWHALRTYIFTILYVFLTLPCQSTYNVVLYLVLPSSLSCCLANHPLFGNKISVNLLLTCLQKFPINFAAVPFIYVQCPCSPEAPSFLNPPSRRQSFLSCIYYRKACLALPVPSWVSLHADSFLFHPFSLVFFCQVIPTQLKMLLCQSQFQLSMSPSLSLHGFFYV